MAVLMTDDTPIDWDAAFERQSETNKAALALMTMEETNAYMRRIGDRADEIKREIEEIRKVYQ